MKTNNYIPTQISSTTTFRIRSTTSAMEREKVEPYINKIKLTILAFILPSLLTLIVSVLSSPLWGDWRGASLYSQNIGINGTGVNAHASALLDVDASPANNTGFLMPRMTSLQRKTIVLPAAGLQVYDLTLKGFYVYDGIKWDCANNPAGTVDYFASAIAPNGYLICDGQPVNRTTYAELFSAIGTLYGVGDGSTTFNVPDLRGEFIRGWDNGRGVDNDVARTIGTFQKGTVMWYDSPPSLTVSSINMNAATDPIARNYVGFDKSSDALWPNVKLTFISGPSSNVLSTNGPESIGGANADYGVIGTSRPRNIALLPCIKF